jgi:tRNA(adenine34) deaminase
VSIEPLYTDEYFMREAMKEARKAFEAGEVPVGAVVVAADRIIARGHNLTERLNDVTAHAEMQCITAAANFLGGKYLGDCTMYITLEPCGMCAGALGWSQLGKLVFSASDEKRGYRIYSQRLLHPKTVIQHGLFAEENEALLKEFFRNKRG